MIRRGRHAADGPVAAVARRAPRWALWFAIGLAATPVVCVGLAIATGLLWFYFYASRNLPALTYRALDALLIVATARVLLWLAKQFWRSR